MCSGTTPRLPLTQTHPDFITLSLPPEADNWRSHLVSLWHRKKKKWNKDGVTARMGHQSKFPLLLHFSATSSSLHPLPASAPLSAPVTISQQRSLGALTSSDVTQLSLSHPDSPPPPPRTRLLSQSTNFHVWLRGNVYSTLFCQTATLIQALPRDGSKSQRLAPCTM